MAEGWTKIQGVPRKIIGRRPPTSRTGPSGFYLGIGRVVEAIQSTKINGRGTYVTETIDHLQPLLTEEHMRGKKIWLFPRLSRIRTDRGNAGRGPGDPGGRGALRFDDA